MNYLLILHRLTSLRIMKKVVLSLLFVFMTGMSVSAQTKSDVTYGIVNTMNDFNPTSIYFLTKALILRSETII